MTKNIPTGIVFYDGPSEITGEPILGIMTGFKSTHNRKTGEMLQTWFLDKKDHPLEAVRTGNDENVCGDCPARGKYCYVDLLRMGPNTVYKSWQNGSYVKAQPKHLELIKGHIVRLGAYGDPASLNIDILKTICSTANGWTGYTHQWRKCNQELRNYCMASVETKDQLELAKSMGWRTFRVKLANEPIEKGEFVCPASGEFEQSRGFKITCDKCLQCNGGSFVTGTGRKTPVINVHGAPWKISQFTKLRVA